MAAKSSCSSILVVLAALTYLCPLGQGLEVHQLPKAGFNSTKLTDNAAVVNDKITINDSQLLEQILLSSEATDQEGQPANPTTFEDLLAVESKVATTKVSPKGALGPPPKGQGGGSLALKREIQEVDVPKLDEEGLNYEFLYRAWENLHGHPNHRYGHPKLHNQALQRQKFHHREERKNGTTRGQYRFRLPHGKIQVVSYRQMGDEYLAKVTYLTEAQEHECLGISKGCKLDVGDIDIGDFEGDVVVGSTPGSSYDDVPIVDSHLEDSQASLTPKVTHNVNKASFEHDPRIPSYVPPSDPYPVHRPTNIAKSPGLFNEMKKNLGLMYGINKQVVVGYGYGGGVPTFNYGSGPDGTIIDFTDDEVQAENSKEEEESPEGPDYTNLENMKAYFDPILSDNVPIKYSPLPKTPQGHAEFFIPSNKIIKHFHSQEKVVGTPPSSKSKKPFTAFEQPSVTVSPPPMHYGNYEDFYGDDFVDDNYYDYGEDVHPTTYKPPYIPIFIKRPEGPIDPSYINLPSFSKDSAKHDVTLHPTPDYVESSYGSLSAQKYDTLQPPPLASYVPDSFQSLPDSEGRNHAPPTHGVGASQSLHRGPFIEDHKVPPTVPQLFTPPINQILPIPIPQYKSTISPNSQHAQASLESHFPVPTTFPGHKVSSTFRPSQDLNTPGLPSRYLPPPNTDYSSLSNSVPHNKFIDSQLGYIPPNNSEGTIHPAYLVKSFTSSSDTDKIHQDFKQISNEQSNSYIPPTGIKPIVSSGSSFAGGIHSSEQPPFGPPFHTVKFPNPASFRQAPPTKPVIFTSGFVPSSSFNVPVTRSKVAPPPSSETTNDSYLESSGSTGVLKSSPQTEKFAQDAVNVSPLFFSPLYDPHKVKAARQYPPLGNANYRTSIIRFPDSETDLRLAPAHRLRSQPERDVHRNRIGFKLEESQQSVSEAFKALDKFHAEAARAHKKLDSSTNSVSARKLAVSPRKPAMTREVNTHEVIVSKSSSSHHKQGHVHPPSHHTGSRSKNTGLRSTAEPSYHLLHPPIAGVVSPERYSLRPRYPYPPYRIPRFVPLFYPFYGAVSVPAHPLSRTIVVPRSRAVVTG